MLTIDWAKIDKFYLVYITVVALLAVLFIFSSKSIFSAYNFAYEIDQSSLDSGLKINKTGLDEIYQWAFDKKQVRINY